MADTIHDRIQKDRDKHKKSWQFVKKFRAYVEGDQDVKLTDRQKAILEGVILNDYCDNVCLQVVCEARDRVVFEGWTCENTAVQEFLKNLFATANLESRSNEVHFDTFQDGNHCLAVSFNNAKNRVEIQREKWWDGREGVFIKYDDNDQPEYAVKEWTDDDDNRRQNIYYPDRIERYIARQGTTGSTGNWEQHRLTVKDENGKDVPEAWPVPWRKKDGKPLGIPIIHLRNSGKGYALYGHSELAGGVIGAQDQLTGIMWDMAGGSRITAFPVYYATGVDADSTFKTGAGAMWKANKETARFGSIPAGDLSTLISVYKTKLQRLSQMTRTPYHLITGGEWPSGEALMRAEEPAIGKATSQIKGLKPAWVEVGHRAIEVWNAFGTGSPSSLPEDPNVARIGAQFGDPSRRDPLSRAVIVNNLGDKISDEEALRIMGYEQSRIDQVIKEKDAKAEKAMEQAATMMSRGIGPGTGLPGKGPQGGSPKPPKPGESGNKPDPTKK
jgi:hypothetical protein